MIKTKCIKEKIRCNQIKPECPNNVVARCMEKDPMPFRECMYNLTDTVARNLNNTTLIYIDKERSSIKQHMKRCIYLVRPQ